MSQRRARQEDIFIVRQLPIDRPVVQYIRQSTRKQIKRNRFSGDMQDADMRNILLAVHGYKPELILPAISKDTGKSGTKRRDEREGLDELYRLIETDSVGAAAAFSVSRIYRSLSLAETGRFCDLLLEHRIPFITKRRIYWPTRDDIKALQDDFQAAADQITDHILGVMVAARDYHVQQDISWGGNAVPVGFQVVETVLEDENREELIRKHYVEYEPHARLVRWLFRRYRELSGNLVMLHRELEHINFRFPPLEPGVYAPLSLHRDVDKYYPLQNRETLIGILTNKVYIGWYEYGGKLISKEAHDPIVSMDEFLFAYDRLAPTTLDGQERERKPHERHSAGMSALLDGVVSSGDLPVYVLNGQYVAVAHNNGWKNQTLVVDTEDIDTVLAPVFIGLLRKIEADHRAGLREALQKQIEEIRQAEQKRADEYSAVLARIDKEMDNEAMAQQVSKREGDEFGYTEATRRLVQLRKDKAAIETKMNQASTEASELAECHDLLECAIRDWECMTLVKRKRLVKLLMSAADMTAPSTHFIRLQCFFISPLNRVMELYIYRRKGGRHVWTEEEIDTLRSTFPVGTQEEIMQALPDCSWVAINQKAQKMGLHRDAPYVLEPALTWSDTQFMAEAGASMEEVV